MNRACLIFILIFCFSCCRKDKNRSLVISKIQTASKLATTETTLDKIIFGTQDRRFLGFINLSETRFVAYSQATVKTGIDMLASLSFFNGVQFIILVLGKIYVWDLEVGRLEGICSVSSLFLLSMR